MAIYNNIIIFHGNINQKVTEPRARVAYGVVIHHPLTVAEDSTLSVMPTVIYSSNR